MGNFVPSTQDERQAMLETIRLKTMEDLFQDVPAEMMLSSLNLPEGMSELEVSREMKEIAKKNKVFSSIFRGAGAYNHYIPAIVKSVTSKETFLTAYTPYQAEISQGILQNIFEYQTMICELTGMDVSNASLYDGASAAAEAVAMCKERKKTRVFISATTNPMVLETVQTYCQGSDTPLVLIPEKDGATDIDALKELITEDASCVYIQQPNFYGILEDADVIGEITHQAKAKFIIGINPIAGAILKTPGECGADVAVGEGQPLGMTLGFGGPYLGFMAATKAMMRRLPGRIVGETTDIDGKRAFVLTLQAREQHIRREKASSNVCSNQALCAMTAAVYMASMGKSGMEEAANQCLSKAHYMAEKLSEVPGFSLRYNRDYFHEFVTECPIDPKVLLKALEEKDILGGWPVDGGILWCATEMNTKAQIHELVNAVKEVCGK